jgi:predicted MPP superfamily phosphohydrolase
MTFASLFVVAFAIWYLPYRFKALLALKASWPLAGVLLLLIAGYFVLIMTGYYTAPNLLAATLYNVLGLVFIFVIFLLPISLIGHLLANFFKPLATSKALAGQLILALGILTYAFVNALNYTVTRFEIELEGLTKPVTIAHVPDLHLGAQRGAGYLKRVVGAINDLNPDLVVFNGDLVDSAIALKPELFALFKDIKAEKYFTTGNHEFYVSVDKTVDLVKQAGIKVLRSQAAQTHGLELIGLEYMNGDRARADAHRVNDLFMDEELPKIPRSGLPTVLLHHSPVGLDEPPKNNISVMLTGHTHGGQIFPGTILIKYRFPYYRGLYKLKGLTLLVSQGAGVFGPWGRLGTFNEIQAVVLVPARPKI